MNEQTIQELKGILSPVLTDAGVDLVKLTLRQQGRVWDLGLLVDKPMGGITIDECTSLNRVLYPLIESSALLGNEFTLEVSSPGMDWPMTTEKDFSRAIGRPLRIFLQEPVGGKIEHRGLLVSVSAERICINSFGKGRPSGTQDSLEIEIPFNKIRKADQMIEEGENYGQQ